MCAFRHVVIYRQILARTRSGFWGVEMVRAQSWQVSSIFGSVVFSNSLKTFQSFMPYSQVPDDLFQITERCARSLSVRGSLLSGIMLYAQKGGLPCIVMFFFIDRTWNYISPLQKQLSGFESISYVPERWFPGTWRYGSCRVVCLDDYPSACFCCKIRLSIQRYAGAGSEGAYRSRHL
jgi:hypothetical protein